jgi:hypothetical protein
MLTLDVLKANLEEEDVYNNFVVAAGTEAQPFVNTFQVNQTEIVANLCGRVI